ncbi:rhodanese-like domain-containing protein [Algihabitans albus]|uniref:rhodanese-like domain-containing protein n=1 Tax=Algihabitans albus TaxID=2164067 RepID=UPI000E5C5863|nr:rhodanese-like domain-containing protein [Algihabitans albus]
MKYVSAETVKSKLTDGDEIAFIDVREHGQYGEGHPFFSVNLPYSLFETRVEALLPSRSVRCVLFDDGDGIAEKAAALLEAGGYGSVQVLEGGVASWAAAGFTLFKGVNVPSKSFGELVEHELGTVSISAEDLKALLDRGDPVVVLDGRSPEEFRKMSLPGARSCPNAELAYRLSSLVPDPRTPVVINCAGRTRSIIGAQTLQECGVANPVFALRNGTQGWRLAGFELNHGLAPQALPALSAAELAETRRRGDEMIRGFGLATVDAETLRAWRAEEQATTYLFDVRTQEEYERAHFPGARLAPGGQLVQATDEKVAVRGARIVLSDDTRLRAATTALWLSGMGHRVWILEEDASNGTATGPESGNEGAANTIALADLKSAVASGAVLLDASSGLDYRDAHVEGALWVTRARLNRLDLPKDGSIVVTGRSRALIAGVIKDLRAMGYARLDAVQGTPSSWQAAGLTLVETADVPSQEDCIDHLFFVHDRHDGNFEASRRYLEWELGLLDQLDLQERSVLTPKRAKRVETV